MNIGECYICSEMSAPLSSCNCKNMYIHDICLITSIKKLNKYNCTICKEPYTNITFKILYKFHLSNYGISFLTTTILCIISLITGSYQLYIYIKSNGNTVTNKNNSIHYHYYNDNYNYENYYNDNSLFLSTAIFFCSFICTGYLLSMLKYMYAHNLSLFYYNKITIPLIKQNLDAHIDTDTNLIMDNVILNE